MLNDLLAQPALGLLCFLDWMRKPRCSVRTKRAILFVRSAYFRVVDANDTYTEGISALLKVFCLPAKIAHDTIDLFDHCLRQDFRFGSDLYGSKGC